MQRQVLAIVGGMVLIGMMSALLMLRRDPEYLYVTSDDGVMTVSGLARSTQAIDVTAAAPSDNPLIKSYVYTIAGEGTIDVPVTLTFTADEELTIFWNDAQRNMWEPLLTTHLAGNLHTALTTRFGQYAVGVAEQVVVPTFVEEYQALRAMAPETAVGYTIAVGYARPDASYIRLLTEGEQGGCAGAMLPGNAEAWSTRTRTASLLVNDVQTTVNLIFVAQWHTDGAGCDELSPFRPTSDRGTLPLSQ